jgi:hypothetical protein
MRARKAPGAATPPGRAGSRSSGARSELLDLDGDEYLAAIVVLGPMDQTTQDGDCGSFTHVLTPLSLSGLTCRATTD